MSEYINRDDALNCFHDWVDKHGDVICADDTAEYIEIASLPSIDLVRCRDCKHKYLDGMTWNCPFGLSGGEDFFCAYGAEDGDSR